VGQDFLIIEGSKSHSRHTIVGGTSDQPVQTLIYNTKHSQQTVIHGPGEIRILNSSRRAAAADPNLRQTALSLASTSVLSAELNLKKQSRNRPGVAQRVPGGLGSQISMTFSTSRW